MIEYTAFKGLNRLRLITNAMEEINAEIKLVLPKIYSKDLIEILFKVESRKNSNKGGDTEKPNE